MKFIIPKELKFECVQCGRCCHNLDILLSSKDYHNITKIDWESMSQRFHKMKLITKTKNNGKISYRLKLTPSGDCPFLTEEKLCFIHANRGKSAKPLVCKVFPFRFIPVEGKVYVGVKSNCPGVLSGKGSKLVSMEQELTRIHKGYRSASDEEEKELPMAPFYLDYLLPWEDFERTENLIISVIKTQELPVLKRLILGSRILEFLKLRALGSKAKSTNIDLDPNLLYKEIKDETLKHTNISFGEKLFFKQFLGYIGTPFLNKDLIFYKRLFHRLNSSWNKMKIVFGHGSLHLEEIKTPVSIARIKKSRVPSPAQSAEELLERYYTANLEARGYFGSGAFNLPVIAGFNLLVITYPLILLLAGASAISYDREVPDLEDYKNAIYIVDRSLYSTDILQNIKGKIASFMLSSPNFAERIALHYSI